MLLGKLVAGGRECCTYPTAEVAGPIISVSVHSVREALSTTDMVPHRGSAGHALGLVGCLRIGGTTAVQGKSARRL